MNHRHILAAATLVLGPLAPMAASAADLIGDTLTITRSWPSTTTPFSGWSPNQVSTTVVASTADTIHWAAGGAPLTIDPDATRIVFTFGSSTSYGSSFDGFVITGFSRDIVSASIQSETLPGTPTLQVLQRQLNLDVNSSVFAGQTIVLNVSVVPEPGAWALLLGGIGALGALARRRQTR